MIMEFDYYCISDKGGREINEDSLGVFCDKSTPFCFVLADGLGGHGNGEVASAEAIEIAKAMYNDQQIGFDSFKSYYELLEKKLSDIQQKNNAPNDYKTTAVFSVIDPKTERFQCAHVGDSRLYYFRRNKILFRTIDHSVPQMLALAGDIKDKEIRHHPDRNRLLKVMGNHSDSIYFELHDFVKIKKGDAILVCSDGFWELIEDKEMCKTLKKSKDASEWGTMMFDIVRKTGQDKDNDNMSAICIRL